MKVETQGLRTFVRSGRQVAHLDRKPIVVGRAAHCDFVLEDELASREHCRIAKDGERIVLSDLGSKNGTLVNGMRVGRRQELHHGDVITIGTQQLTIARLRHTPRPTSVIVGPPSGEPSTEPTEIGGLFEILQGAVFTALSSRDLAGAEASAYSLFATIRGAIPREPLLPGTLERAFEAGIALAVAYREPSWLENVLELATMSRTPLAASLLETFVAAANKVGPPRRMRAQYERMAGPIRGL